MICFLFACTIRNIGLAHSLTVFESEKLLIDLIDSVLRRELEQMPNSLMFVRVFLHIVLCEAKLSSNR